MNTLDFDASQNVIGLDFLRGRTNWLQEFDALTEVPHEGERADSLAKSRDFPKLGHEAVLLGELHHRAAITLVILDRL